MHELSMKILYLADAHSLAGRIEFLLTPYANIVGPIHVFISHLPALTAQIAFRPNPSPHPASLVMSQLKYLYFPILNVLAAKDAVKIDFCFQSCFILSRYF